MSENLVPFQRPLNPLEVKVERMGPYCVLRVTGQLHGVILPMRLGQARRVLRDMERVIAQIEEAKSPTPKG
jgi:hypothetical protein